ALIQSPGNLGVGSTRDGEGQVMEIADPLWIRRRIICPRRPYEESNQSPITWVEVKMGFLWNVQIGLVEDQWHTQHILIEIDDRFAVRTDKSDVMHALRLNL